MARFGAYTDRCRDNCVACSTTAPFTQPTEATKFPGCQEIMTKTEDVPPLDRAPHYSRIKRSSKAASDQYRAKKVDEVNRGGGGSTDKPLHNRLYSPDHQWSGNKDSQWVCDNKGSQWVCDSIGPRR